MIAIQAVKNRKINSHNYQMFAIQVKNKYKYYVNFYCKNNMYAEIDFMYTDKIVYIPN
ncbi:hypothetical protein H8356DRAFT_1336395 [Neocallimastix lanati (nom. inval.)]|nr:hypothetical protein H8356DRAFT_1336395 [Neocallimastix sp. JGI-2020a]